MGFRNRSPEIAIVSHWVATQEIQLTPTNPFGSR